MVHSRVRRTYADRVDALDFPTTQDGCILFDGAPGSSGYGQVSHRKKVISAHRYSYMSHVGPIPRGLHVLHSCDNRACVNPNHLSLGTNADNVADRTQRGRSASGDRHGRSRIPNRYVAYIFEMRNMGLTQREIGYAVGVHRSAVGKILSGKSRAQ